MGHSVESSAVHDAASDFSRTPEVQDQTIKSLDHLFTSVPSGARKKEQRLNERVGDLAFHKLSGADGQDFTVVIGKKKNLFTRALDYLFGKKETVSTPIGLAVLKSKVVNVAKKEEIVKYNNLVAALANKKYQFGLLGRIKNWFDGGATEASLIAKRNIFLAVHQVSKEQELDIDAAETESRMQEVQTRIQSLPEDVRLKFRAEFSFTERVLSGLKKGIQNLKERGYQIEHPVARPSSPILEGTESERRQQTEQFTEKVTAYQEKVVLPMETTLGRLEALSIEAGNALSRVEPELRDTERLVKYQKTILQKLQDDKGNTDVVATARKTYLSALLSKVSRELTTGSGLHLEDLINECKIVEATLQNISNIVRSDEQNALSRVQIQERLKLLDTQSQALKTALMTSNDKELSKVITEKMKELKRNIGVLSAKLALPLPTISWGAIGRDAIARRKEECLSRDEKVGLLKLKIERQEKGVQLFTDYVEFVKQKNDLMKNMTLSKGENATSASSREKRKLRREWDALKIVEPTLPSLGLDEEAGDMQFQLKTNIQAMNMCSSQIEVVMDAIEHFEE